MPALMYDSQQFLLDGNPLRILSGAIHYFRVPPTYWRDRLEKLRACGLNTVETYLPWNLHEPREGEYCFEGGCDVVAFVNLARELELKVILRPGPYICAEWEFGGLPAWLMADPGMRLRCNYPPYLAKVDRYFDILIPKLVPLLWENGGPVIAMQVENEYGSYGNDKDYLRHIEEGLLRRGVCCRLFTSDGGEEMMLAGGTLPHLLKTVNFGSGAKENFDALRAVQPDAPLMCCEFWDGWFNHWGSEHHTQTPDAVVKTLEDMLDAGASVNFYMFHGGTNFGFLNGANCYDGVHLPTVSSYDYDALLTEAGDLTPKYHRCKAVLEQRFGRMDLPVENTVKAAYGTIKLTEYAGLFEVLEQLSTPVRSACTLSMEELGQDYGYILYRSRVSGPATAQNLRILELHDRAQVFADGRYLGAVGQDGILDVPLPTVAAGAELQLDILVENLGRINYGEHLGQRKGIVKGVLLGQQFHFGWDIFCLPLHNLSALRFSPVTQATGPAFYRGRFLVEEAHDTWLHLPGWVKGVAWVNGVNLGRYWDIGPERTLFVPAPLLRTGENTLELFEQHGCAEPAVELIDHPVWGE